MSTPTGESTPAPTGTPGEEPLPELDVTHQERQRRWTVLLRLLLLIPQFIVLYVLYLAAVVVVLIGWFAALVMGRLPGWCFQYLSGYLGYAARVNAYVYLLTDAYPPFAWSAPGHDAGLTLPAQDRLNRLAVLFRIILLIPAYIVAAVVASGWTVLAFFFWLIVLVLGRVPGPVFGASAAALRYELRFMAYTLLVTSAYPKMLFGDDKRVQRGGTGPAATSSDTRPLLLSTGGKVLLVAMIVLGVLGLGGSGATSTAGLDSAETGTSEFGG
ncbi:DUF4389 domain-containing protein [Haloechinothrix alba]|uniref:DUF4389 domain-containing protein n=1 Tax=Haloechinothrix alba TaxID=664784 RepID=UPI001FEB0B9D|nr:DUF4389 domain-containing protein [Haloechinothrix alba]